MSRTDQASGLLRYEQFLLLLNRDLAMARRDGRPIALIGLEIVELDVYRSTFGAKAADSCIRMIAAQLTGTLRRAGDLCARYSDAMLVASVLGQDAVQAGRLADRIVENVRGLKLHNPRAQSGRYVSVVRTVIGGAVEPDEDGETLVARLLRSSQDVPRVEPLHQTYA